MSDQGGGAPQQKRGPGRPRGSSYANGEHRPVIASLPTDKAPRRAGIRKDHRQFRENLEAGAAAALRMDGYTFEEIARILGVEPHRAKNLVDDYLSHIAASDVGERDRAALRRREDMRLDRLLYSVWAKALDEEHPEQLGAIRIALAISERMSKLHGLDAPQEVIVHSPTTAEIDNWVASVARVAHDHGVVEAEVVDADIVDELPEASGG